MEKINEVTQQRLNKLNQLRKLGVEPYAGKFSRTHAVSQILENFSSDVNTSVAGRIMNLRSHGRAIFADLKDQSGKIQLYFKEDILGSEKFALFEKLDIGDILGVYGETFRTRSGEPTLKVLDFQILSKSLRPLPEKWHGLKDIETRYRQRYLDLIANQECCSAFVMRTRIISAIRDFLNSRGYLEVETPILQPLAGGAAGRPFETYHHSLGVTLYLRIAPELYLKRLLVGGFERVYEINKSFRNEGISPRHSPEFTMLEAYTAFADYQDMMNLTEELIVHLAKTILGKTKLKYQDREIDLTPPWRRCSFAQEMEQNFGILPEDSAASMLEKLKRRKALQVEETGRLSRTQVAKIAEDLLLEKAEFSPTFFIDYFTSLSPLAKCKKDNPFLAERFELFIGGLELANAYSELNDPLKQRERMEQGRGSQEGNIDEDFLLALEYGMPPAGGLGIGIDRLVMIFTNQFSIRDVILFPQLKPESR
jgi:lysyl-tRNA synthetase class 2